MDLHEAYKQKRAAQLKEWSAQISLLDAKLENAEANVKLKYADELNQLRARQDAAVVKMNELTKASGEAWVQARDTADKMWEELKTGVDAARAKFL